MVIFAVNGLDSRFATLAEIIHHRKPLPTFETVRNMLLLKETLVYDDSTSTTFESSSSSPTILMASSSSNTKGNINTQSKSQNPHNYVIIFLEERADSGTGALPSQPMSQYNTNGILGAAPVLDNKYTIEFDAFGFSVKDFLTRRILLRCDSSGDLYPVTKSLNLLVAFVSTSSSTWQQRLGHPGDKVLHSLTSRRFISCNKEKSSHVCHACQLGKHVKLHFHSSDSIVTKCFDIIHYDLWTSPIHIVDSLDKEFDMTNLKALNYFLGISDVRHPIGLFSSQ
nr:ribonuclease H-like domain-containing protein [Tanacetum cinerariifolium]